MNPAIETLLVLQEKDQQLHRLHSQQASLPGERTSLLGKKARAEAQVAEGNERLRQGDLARKSIQQERTSLEATLLRYKSQQLLVKKNEEYQALSHEIEQTEAAIGSLEEQEIGLLLEADEDKSAVEKIREESAREIAGLDQLLQALVERENILIGQVQRATAEVESASASVPAHALLLYHRLRGRVAFPIVVPISEQRCTGCHLRISSGVESAVREGTEVTTCDNCGRILFY